ncbi:MAG: BCCT family transporter, partial [Actinomycetota bacterium]
FFATSSDSGSLVVDILTNGGDPDPVWQQRFFWAVLEGAVAAVLLLVGGLTALQTASIAAGLPFAFVLLFMCFSLLKGLRQELVPAASLEGALVTGADYGRDGASRTVAGREGGEQRTR